MRRSALSAFIRTAALLAAAGLHGACAQAPEPAVPVAGEAADLAALAGEWSGSYSSAATGRSGLIHFRLTAEDGFAQGEVTMIPAGSLPRLEAANRAPQAAPEQLVIHFVAVAGDLVSGTIEPYRDPDCGCILSTTFQGRVRGDVIDGTFVSYGGRANLPQRGEWRVERKPR
jgi:hypothetical protein